MKKNLWDIYTDTQRNELEEFNTAYRMFLDAGKTERECVTEIVQQAKAQGYRDLTEVDRLKAGDKVYATHMEKAVALFRIGSDDFAAGMNLLGAHIDSPRIDLKQNPLYEDNELAYFDTHYYGGIKKYQWVTIPLALHGVVVRKDGTKVAISIGENDSDPVFVITDLLIHLSAKQLDKKANVVIEGENLDLLIGSKPLKEEEKDAVAKQIAQILKDTYDFELEDLQSAELEIVPAGKARECGLDRSMIMAYGQDDRVCAYTSLRAIFDAADMTRTACCILVDKEEIGSLGSTGMHSRFFENMVAELMDKLGNYSELHLRRALANSTMISSDVAAGFDPLYKEVYAPKAAAFLGKGLVLKKHTGARGKVSSNDANAEYIARIRKVFADNEITFQMSEMGKVDAGGGGTIAYILAQYGMEVIDGGVCVLNMHAPYEISSKADIYEAYRGYMAFLQDMK